MLKFKILLKSHEAIEELQILKGILFLCETKVSEIC